MSTATEENEWACNLNVILVLLAIGFIAIYVRENPKWNTEIVHRYQKGDYQLELTIDGDKVDTLYIFK